MGRGASSISQAFRPLSLPFSEGPKLKLIGVFRGVKILLERHLRISNIVSPKLCYLFEFKASENRRGARVVDFLGPQRLFHKPSI